MAGPAHLRVEDLKSGSQVVNPRAALCETISPPPGALSEELTRTTLNICLRLSTGSVFKYGRRWSSLKTKKNAFGPKSSEGLVVAAHQGLGTEVGRSHYTTRLVEDANLAGFQRKRAVIWDLHWRYERALPRNGWELVPCGPISIAISAPIEDND